MVNKEKIWVLPFIGGILAFISMLTPVATHVVTSSMTFYCWTWFLLSVGTQVQMVVNINNALYLYIGILAYVLILVAFAIIMITLYKIRKEEITDKLVGWCWLVSGVLLIGGLIITILILSSYLLDNYIVNFSVFGQAIAAIIVILGAYLFIKENSL